MGNCGSSAAIVLVLFILLIIILGAWIQEYTGGVKMSNIENSCCNKGGSGLLIVIVLYILLAIILGSTLFYQLYLNYLRIVFYFINQFFSDF